MESSRAMRETVSDVFLETLQSFGVRCLFANLGTDYPPIVESLAKYREQGQPMPEIVLCPHEITAITAAHGFALATGQGQGVFVHVGVGTQNLGGALHNAWTGRVPMLIFAGRSPVGTRGERPGGRDNPIHYFQDVRDQAGVVRQFCKWEFNLEAPEQAAYAFQRAVRLMQSEPTGAVYMTAAREVLSYPVGEMLSEPPERAARVEPGELSAESARRIAEGLARAERPLVITSYAGRDPAAVEALVQLSEALQLPVVEMAPSHLNFPRTHPHHWGYRANPAVSEADYLLIVDTDVPWLGKHGAPGRDVPVVQLDVDPLKPHIVMWDFPVTESHAVSAARALAQVGEQARRLPAPAEALRQARREWLASRGPAPALPDTQGKLTPDSLSALLGRLLDPRTVVFDESVTSADSIWRLTRRTEPGSYFGSPGSSLGWGSGAALGYKLARPDRDVVSLTGDGSFLFGVPSSLYMTAQHYGAPFLTIIYNNAGWGAVKMSTKRVYGSEGSAARSGAYFHEIGATGNLEQVAGAFGCFTACAETESELESAWESAWREIRGGRSAVINALLSKEGPEPE